MFTGLIEETGKITAIREFDGGLEYDIEAHVIMDDLAIDHSVSVDGACQTVVKLDSSSFTIQSIKETLDKTTFSEFNVGDHVNLERAMKPETRVGGHYVQGHVNGVGTVSTIEQRGENYLIGVRLKDELLKFCILEGSITIDGISLTIADIKDDEIFVSIIPHTWNVTTINSAKIDDAVNIENDMFAKYIFRYLESVDFKTR